MGTHPIFESDFDCLTERDSAMNRPPRNVSDMISLKIDNLSYRTDTETLRRKFGKYGEIGDVYIPKDRRNGESRGFAFVRYPDKRDAEGAIDGLNGYELDGREIRVDYARHERPPLDSRGRGGGHRRGGRSRSRSRDRGGRRGGGRRSRSRSRSPRRRRSRSRSRSRSDSRDRRDKSRDNDRRSKSRSRSRSASKSRSRSR